MSYGVRRHRFNVDNLEMMVATGILDEGAKIELIDGEIFDMGPHGDAHIMCTMRLNRVCSTLVGDDLWVGVHGPLLIHEETQFRPDLTIHRSSPSELVLPNRENTLLVIEIADLSLDFDRNKKLPYYGKWQIPEAWLFDLTQRRIERHTEPNLEGYTHIEAVQGSGSLTSTVLPKLVIAVDAILRY